MTTAAKINAADTLAGSLIAGQSRTVASPAVEASLPVSVAANQTRPLVFPNLIGSNALAGIITAVAPAAGAGGTADSLSGARVITAMPRIAIAVLRARRQIRGGGTGKLACLMIHRKRHRHDGNKPGDNDFFHCFNS